MPPPSADHSAELRGPYDHEVYEQLRERNNVRFQAAIKNMGELYACAKPINPQKGTK